MRFFLTMCVGIVALTSTISCTKDNTENMKVSQESITPGTSVKLGGTERALHPGELKVGQDFFAIASQSGFNLERKVSIVNIVPSIDTPVCEAQSHILGEDPSIQKEIARVSISRDLPMAQKRFAKEAKLTNIKYFSDYKSGSFGKQTGLLIEEEALLARAVLVTDSNGIIQYLQVVPDVVELPDMKKAIEFANKLSVKAISR